MFLTFNAGMIEATDRISDVSARAWEGLTDFSRNLRGPRDPDKGLSPDESVHLPAGPPLYKPQGWNDFSGYFNCYSYALRLPKAGRAEPGRLVGGPTGRMRITARALDLRLRVDGLERVRDHGANPDKDHVIAAFISPGHPDDNFMGRDFHFYSLDSDKQWSHKTGMEEVERVDAMGKPIDDPRKACRDYGSANYSQFTGFYRVPERGLVYTNMLYDFSQELGF